MNYTNEKEKIEEELAELIEKVEILKEKLNDIELKTDKKYNPETLAILESQLKNVLKKEKITTDKILNVSHKSLPGAKLIISLQEMPTIEETDLVLSYIEEWFENLSIEKLENIDDTSHVLMSRIRELGLLEIKGISLSGALTNGEKTVVTRIGNTPIYKYKNGDIEPINIEKNTLISQEVIDNDDYQTIVLFSDSFEDDLTDERIKVISKNTNREKLANDLIEFNEEKNKIK